MQEFGTPKSTFFLKVKFAIFDENYNFCDENVEDVSIPDSDRARFFTPLRVRDLTKNLSLNSKHTIFEEKRIYK